MYEYLNDQSFLNQLDRINIRVMHLKLTLLDFQERPIRELAGTASGNGSLNLNGASATRRTISFNMLATGEKNDLTDLDNIISINKKFKIAVGIENPLVKYQNYGDIIWFPLGMYVISKASLSLSTTSCTIAISGKDKMCMLDGSVGGTLPNTVVFHEIYEQNNEEGYVISYPTIRRIIFEAVQQYGGESPDNIIINDLDDKIKKLVKWGGDSPVWITTETQGLVTNIHFNDPKGTPDDNTIGVSSYGYGEDVGYTQTDFTYPGELILSAGETVVALLNKIISVLGNYEFFYNLEGKFVFQEVPNYLNKSFSLVENDNATQSNYVRTFNNSKYAYAFQDSDTLMSINNNPNYDNIKNDFIVWGQRPLTGGATKAICYRLVIDEKPELDLCKKYMYKIIDSKKQILRYEFFDNDITFPILQEGETSELIAEPCTQGKYSNGLWREELYRQALLRSQSGENNAIAGPYDQELIAFWRENFDSLKKDWIEGWNPDIINNNYDKLNYWLDFIDISSQLGQYSVNNIGRRIKVKNDDKVRTLLNREVPDIIFVQNTNNLTEMSNLINNFNVDGQKYCFLTEEHYEKLLTSTTGSSAYDVIRELLYQHLIYNTQVTMTGIPKYYLDANILIYIQNQKSGIAGEFVIKSLTLPLGYSGTMNITANEALTRI